MPRKTPDMFVQHVVENFREDPPGIGTWHPWPIARGVWFSRGEANAVAVESGRLLFDGLDQVEMYFPEAWWCYIGPTPESSPPPIEYCNICCAEGDTHGMTHDESEILRAEVARARHVRQDGEPAPFGPSPSDEWVLDRVDRFLGRPLVCAACHGKGWAPEGAQCPLCCGFGDTLGPDGRVGPGRAACPACGGTGLRH